MDDLTGRKLMVVAHPDDETLWGGGLILRYPGNWTVVACSTPMADPVRAEKFLAAIERLGATGSVLPFLETFSSRLSVDVDVTGYDVVVTHGPEGEYGHPHHIQVHHAVAARATGRLLTFGGPCPIELTTAERAAKLHALKAYDHVLPYDGVPMMKWEALLARYGAQWLERESYG